MDYWTECISIAFNEEGISATPEQIEQVAGHVEGGHENYSMAHGYDVIESLVETNKDRTIASLKKEIADLEGQVIVYRKSVAMRRGVSESDVYLERYKPDRGDVMYND